MVRARTGLWATVVMAAALPGCNMVGLPLYAIMAEIPVEQKAEYDLTPAARSGQLLLIRVWADDTISWNHENATKAVAEAVRDMMLRRDPQTREPSPLQGLKIVPVRDVERYLNTRSDGGQSVSPETLGERFSADLVLDITLEEYTIHAGGSSELLQGRIAGTFNLFDRAHAFDGMIPLGARRVAITYPDSPYDVSGGQSTQRILWNELRSKFAERIFKKLHNHMVPRKPDLKDAYRNQD